MKPEPAALIRFLRLGLGSLYAGSMLDGADTSLRLIRNQEQQARAAGILHGSVDEHAMRSLLGGHWSTPAGDRRSVLADLLFPSLLPTLAQVQARQDAMFFAGLERILAGDRGRALTVPLGETPAGAALRKLVEQWANKFGADGLAKATLAKPYLDAAIVGPATASGAKRVLEAPGLYDLNPYLEFHDREDEKVRPNHHLLHGFIARTNWRGWDLYCLPPLGWNCRCLVYPISWSTARSRGLAGDFPAGSLDKFQRFIDAGGPDAKFPRELFVSGSAA